MDLLLPRRAAARRSPRRSSTCPATRPVKLHGPVQGRDPRLLGPGLPHEDRRGAGHRHAPTASRRPTATGNYPVVCAELCGLGHSTMRQTAHVMTRAGLRRLAARSCAAAGGGAGRRRWRRRRRTTDGKTLFTDAASRPPAASLPHARGRRDDGHDRPEPRRGAAGPKRRGVHPRSRSRTRTRRSPRASQPGIMPRLR